MEDLLVPILIPLGICVVLPVMVVWLIVRHKTNETNKRSEIVIAAIEKNSEIDVEDFFKKMTPPRKTRKEKLQQWLLWGSILTAAGLALLGLGLYLDYSGGANNDKLTGLLMFGIISFFVGVAVLIVYAICRKDLAKELENEEKSEKKE